MIQYLQVSSTPSSQAIKLIFGMQHLSMTKCMREADDGAEKHPRCMTLAAERQVHPGLRATLQPGTAKGAGMSHQHMS